MLPPCAKIAADKELHMSPYKKTAYVPPYISSGEFEKFLNILRIRTPDPLTAAELQKLGFTGSNSYTLFGTLKAMGLYNENGKALDRQDLVDLGSRDEITRRDALERIFNRTYADWLERNSVHDATLESLETYFTVKGAVKSISIKAARLFFWLAQRAGLVPLRVAEYEDKPEANKKSTSKKQLSQRSPAKERRDRSGMALPNVSVKTADEAEDMLLNMLLAKINSAETLPPVELVEQARQLIASKRERTKDHDANNAVDHSDSKDIEND
jgi:hypothetical protein